MRGLNIGFIGAGKLGTCLAWALTHAYEQTNTPHRVHAVYSKTPQSMAECAQAINAVQCENAQAVSDLCDVVFITVQDAYIQTVCNTVRWRTGQWVVHCSGSTSLDAVSKAWSDGAHIAGLHPLKTFAAAPATKLMAYDSLQGCTAGVEMISQQTTSETNQASNQASNQAVDNGQHNIQHNLYVERGEHVEHPVLTCVEALNMHAMHIPSTQRAIYHAGANYAGAFIPALLQEAVLLWQSMGVTQAQALQALLPLLKSTVVACENVIKNQQGLPFATVGAVARGDVSTLDNHLQALLGFNESASELYIEMSKRVLALAIQRGSLSADQIKQIQHLLNT